ncbi:MAG: hypothetical protein KAV98_01860 [Dehalococcoidia bacterium]|nr:hypothetical protein [Dehalococcoidia bacterium]
MDLAQGYERKPIVVMPQRLSCPHCQFSVLAVDEVLEDGTICWRCLGCGRHHYKLWRCGEFAAEEYDSR